MMHGNLYIMLVPLIEALAIPTEVWSGNVKISHAIFVCPL